MINLARERFRNRTFAQGKEKVAVSRPAAGSSERVSVTPMEARYAVVANREIAVQRILVGIAFGLGAFAANAFINATIYAPSYLPLFFGAVIITAWSTGTLAAITCLLVCIPGILLFGEPRYEILWKGGDDILRIALVTLVCSMVITIDHKRRTQIAQNGYTQRILNDERNRLRVALNAGKMGTCEWYIQKERLVWSPEAESMHGLENGEFTGTLEHFMRIVHPEDRVSVAASITDTLRAGAGVIDVEYRVALPSGVVRWIAGKGGVRRDHKGPSLMTGVVWDITERKRAEISLAEAAVEMRRAGAMKDEFLGMVSHELRNPITMIYSGARLLRTRYDTLDEENRIGVLGDMEHEAERLQLIVENLLALAREEFAPSSEPEPVSVNRTLEAAISRMRKARPSRKIVFRRSGEAYASVVPIYLDLILRNLIDNADKYSPRGAPVELAAEQEEGAVVISVRDYGPGVAPENLERLFDRFFREEAIGGVSGAGIGLTVCQRLAENQGGKMAVENAPDGGLRIEVRVPACDLSEA